jgi:hypothetical protein
MGLSILVEQIVVLVVVGAQGFWGQVLVQVQVVWVVVVVGLVR